MNTDYNLKKKLLQEIFENTETAAKAIKKEIANARQQLALTVIKKLIETEDTGMNKLINSCCCRTIYIGTGVIADTRISMHS